MRPESDLLVVQDATLRGYNSGYIRYSERVIVPWRDSILLSVQCYASLRSTFLLISRMTEGSRVDDDHTRRTTLDCRRVNHSLRGVVTQYRVTAIIFRGPTCPDISRQNPPCMTCWRWDAAIYASSDPSRSFPPLSPISYTVEFLSCFGYGI